MAIFIRILLFILPFVLVLPPLAQADGSSPDTGLRKPADQSSANFNKTQRFLPGEEVITPTGKKMKVWSSEGPVPVSRPPEPFEDREKSVLQGNVIVDAESTPLLRDDKQDQRPAADRDAPERAKPAPLAPRR